MNMPVAQYTPAADYKQVDCSYLQIVSKALGLTSCRFVSLRFSPYARKEDGYQIPKMDGNQA